MASYSTSITTKSASVDDITANGDNVNLQLKTNDEISNSFFNTNTQDRDHDSTAKLDNQILIAKPDDNNNNNNTVVGDGSDVQQVQTEPGSSISLNYKAEQYKSNNDFIGCSCDEKSKLSPASSTSSSCSKCRSKVVVTSTKLTPTPTLSANATVRLVLDPKRQSLTALSKPSKFTNVPVQIHGGYSNEGQVLLPANKMNNKRNQLTSARLSLLPNQSSSGRSLPRFVLKSNNTANGSQQPPAVMYLSTDSNMSSNLQQVQMSGTNRQSFSLVAPVKPNGVAAGGPIRHPLARGTYLLLSPITNQHQSLRTVSSTALTPTSSTTARFQFTTPVLPIRTISASQSNLPMNTIRGQGPILINLVSANNNINKSAISPAVTSVAPLGTKQHQQQLQVSNLPVSTGTELISNNKTRRRKTIPAIAITTTTTRSKKRPLSKLSTNNVTATNQPTQSTNNSPFLNSSDIPPAKRKLAKYFPKKQQATQYESNFSSLPLLPEPTGQNVILANQIYHIYHNTLGKSLQLSSSLYPQQFNQSVYKCLYGFYAEVFEFKQQIVQLMNPEFQNLLHQQTMVTNIEHWIEILLLRSCWYSARRCQVDHQAINPFLGGFHQSNSANQNQQQPQIWFDANHQLNVTHNSFSDDLGIIDTATESIFESMLDFTETMIHYDLDEIELSLLSAWLLFSPSHDHFFDVNHLDELARKSLHDQINSIMFDYQKPAPMSDNPNINNNINTENPVKSAKSSFRAMNILLTLADLAYSVELILP